MIDGCDKHGERARKLLAAWNAMFNDDKEKALNFSVTEKGYFIQFRTGGIGGIGPTLDAAFDGMEKTIRSAAAEDVGQRREMLDKAMARSLGVEDALA